MDHPTIVITGASRGLGEMTARAAAGWGANVVLAARSEGRLREEAQAMAAGSPEAGEALVVVGDVSRAGDCAKIIQAAAERFGRIDGLVNNAGVIEPIARIAEADVLEWERNWAVNFRAPLLLTQMALPHLRRQHGRVINISSGSASAVIQGWGAYSSNKAAIEYFTRELAAEEADITALAVRPGILDTEMQATIRERGKAGMADSDYQRLYGLYEKKRLIPAEVSGRVVACLALFAPHEWSGETVQWNDEKVQALVEARIQGS
jgi:NAD(P)-dependent dehydrogenase (short-subunit alcohol dehydrogenase family)